MHNASSFQWELCELLTVIGKLLKLYEKITDLELYIFLNMKFCLQLKPPVCAARLPILSCPSSTINHGTARPKPL